MNCYGEANEFICGMTDFGQIEIYNKLFKDATAPRQTPTECIYGRSSYYGFLNGKRVPAMIGSRLHVHKEDNPLDMDGYFIIDGICKSVSSMYMLDRVPFTNDRAYLSDGTRVDILSMGKYEINKGGKVRQWYLPYNYEEIAECSEDVERMKAHLDLVFHARKPTRYTPAVNHADAVILSCMFERWLNENMNMMCGEVKRRYRLVTAGELVWDALQFGEDVVKCFRTHVWPVKNIRNVTCVSEDMKHYSRIGDVEAIRRITLPTQRENTRLEDRLVRMQNQGYMCPVQTADGTLCGTIMYLCEGARVSNESSKWDSIKDESIPKTMSVKEGIRKGRKLVFVNGMFMGYTHAVATYGKRCENKEEESMEENGRMIMMWNRIGRIQAGTSDVSVTVGQIPYRKHNPAVRAMFASSMIKQAITMDRIVREGMFHDTKYLVEGEQPIVGREFAYAAGWNLDVAIMPWYGYNVEDAVVIREGVAEKYTTDKISIYSGVLDTRYARVIDEYVRVGEKVNAGDALFRMYYPNKVTTIEVVRSMQEGIVSAIVKHERCYMVKVVRRRQMEVGDKMTSRHGQKGVVSLIVPDDKMPMYLKDGEWKRIDLMINPHAFPSRMTMGQIKEMGNQEHVVKIPGKGEHKPCYELRGGILVGPCYYMALRHQVLDKVQSRDVHCVDKVSLQAVSGKAKIGGLRFGHMERDILLAVGAHDVLKKMYAIDEIDIETCGTCGTIWPPAKSEVYSLFECGCSKEMGVEERVWTKGHQYLMLCAGYLKGLGYEMKYWPRKREYAIERGGKKIQRIESYDEIWFGEHDPLDVRVWECAMRGGEKKRIRVLPMILRSNHLDAMYAKMHHVAKHEEIEKEIRRLLVGKYGAYHKYVEGHRVNHCVRSVIVPNPTLAMDTVEIPFGCDIGKSYGLLNRQPSLNVGSLMSMKLVVGKHRTIGLNPMLCKSFNADFDGDEMCIYGIDGYVKELPCRSEAIQDYLLGTLEEVTLMGLTANKAGMELMISNKSKGKPFNLEHMYVRIGNVIVNGTVVGSIEHCYWDGLTDREWYYQAMAAREGAASIGVNTPFTGDLETICNRMFI